VASSVSPVTENPVAQLPDFKRADFSARNGFLARPT